ncbi:serine/threonine-protein kinase [Streptosporangium sp. NPDC048047]|uniref:serine/threonine protein kinase n=1 Tax=Streptosporangium sp. NPDC048047 TaxID=3155748 RepID=UPI0034268F60
MSDVHPPEPGDPTVLGPYRVIGRIGEGGQGAVYLAEPAEPPGTGSGLRVAVKLYHARVGGEPSMHDDLVREAELAKRVARFCTAQVLDFGLYGMRPYLVSEYVPGPSLQHVVVTEGPRSGSALERLAVGTATALVALHDAGVVHRDFKPQNVLLGPDGPRVIDFGIARSLAATGTMTSGIVGTPAYMAPEQLDASEPGLPLDVFAWASTMAFAATGRPPFGNDSIPAIINRILNEEPVLDGIEQPLLDLLRECLAKDPARRPTAQQILARLVRGGHGEPVGQGGHRGPGGHGTTSGGLPLQGGPVPAGPPYGATASGGTASTAGTAGTAGTRPPAARGGRRAPRVAVAVAAVAAVAAAGAAGVVLLPHGDSAGAGSGAVRTSRAAAAEVTPEAPADLGTGSPAEEFHSTATSATAAPERSPRTSPPPPTRAPRPRVSDHPTATRAPGDRDRPRPPETTVPPSPPESESPKSPKPSLSRPPERRYAELGPGHFTQYCVKLGWEWVEYRETPRPGAYCVKRKGGTMYLTGDRLDEGCRWRYRKPDAFHRFKNKSNYCYILQAPG